MRPETNIGPERSSAKRSHDEIVRDRKAHLVDLVGRRLGEAIGVKDLGPMAAAFMETVAGPQMKKALRSETKAVPAGLAKQLADDLEDLVSKDRFVAAPPSNAQDRPSVLDDRQVQIVPNRGQQTHALAGNIDLGAHVLGDVLRKFDIDGSSMVDTVADALKVGFTRRADLANPKTWLSIVPQMAAAAMATKGPWQARIGAAALAGVHGLASQPQIIEAEAQPVAQLEGPDGTTRGNGTAAEQRKLLGAAPAARRVEQGSTERKPGTMAGGVLGLAQSMSQSDDSRKIASEAKAFFAELGQVLDDPELDEVSRLFSSAAAKGAGSGPRLHDLSGMPAPDQVVWPDVDPKVLDFAHDLLGAQGLNVNVVGANEMAASNFVGILGMASTVAEQAAGRPVDFNDPQDQVAVLRVAIENLGDVSPTARALSGAFEAVAKIDPEEAEILSTQLGRHRQKIATTWVVEGLTTRDPDAVDQARSLLQAELRDVEEALKAHDEAPPELANVRTTITAQLEALAAPDGDMAKIVLNGGLAELQFPGQEPDGPDPVGWARMARSSYEKAAGHAQMNLDLSRASSAVAPEAAGALARSAMAAIWNVAAEAAGAASVESGGGVGGGPPRRPGGAGRSDGGGPGGPRGPGDFDGFDNADSYAAGMGARVDKRDKVQEGRQSFDDIRAILNDPSLEFFDKIFLVMTMLIDRMRTKVEEDQIDQLDREEMMWINEQLAHEYQKEVEMAQRDIHELGKEVDKAAGAYTKSERHLKQLEATPEAERAPDHDKQVADARKVFEESKAGWTDHMGRFEQRKTVLNELRDARDAHRVQIASDRRSADIFAAKVKRNTHVVEMYMDLIKTFEEHKQRNLQRMLS